jgi:hypothetical protein
MIEKIMTLVDYLPKVGLQEELVFFEKQHIIFGQKMIELEEEKLIGAK